MHSMHRRALIPAVIAILLLPGGGPLVAVGQTTAAIDELVADCEAGTVEKLLTVRNAQAHVVTDPSAPQGRSFLRVDLETASDENGAYVRFDVRLDRGFADRQSFVAMLRAPDAPEQVQLRWLALDGQGRPIFQRRFQLEASQQWIELDAPLKYADGSCASNRLPNALRWTIFAWRAAKRLTSAPDG
jgi:hypothetical protein